ncbi:putative cupin superfamily protein [Salinibacterium sp. CAN_S4]|uniref:cupin domain-containing protein n=1 Tax=Salinibacterium sp. CAN_S4 TaxID=2787727 RepID=UPI0018EFC613
MTDLLRPGFAIDALTAPVTTEPLPSAQISSGSPSAGELELVAGETEIGIWEHSPGTSTDVEVDEVFVVLSGSATVEFMESGVVLRLAPGVVARFAAGTATRWTVTETIRKIYIA